MNKPGATLREDYITLNIERGPVIVSFLYWGC